MKTKTQPEIELLDGETSFRARYDYDRGEDQWFDARAGVGSPGYPPSVCITEVNFGAGWEDPEAYPQLDLEACEVEIMDKLAESEAAEHAAQAEAEYEAWQESKKYKDWDKQ
jgi:hypothetical protein